MTFVDSVPIAKQLAEKQLEKGFDVEAFLILCEISKLDSIPESNIDEHISDIGKIFQEYYYNPTLEALNKLVNSFIQAFSEIYNSVDSLDKKNLIKTRLNTFTSTL